VVRGADHLTNMTRQAQIYEALGWPLPSFAHVPLIHGPDGAKLSKRHGALGVEAYREMGYLPAALRNYLVRLGWSHGDDEIFSTEQMTQWFDLPDIGRSPARFDFDKLEKLNAHYIRETGDPELAAMVRALLPELGGEYQLPDSDNEEKWVRFEQALPGLKERAKTLLDLIDGAGFIFDTRPLAIDDKAGGLLDDNARDVLGGLLSPLEALEYWSVETIEQTIRSYADEKELKLGKIAQPLRAALTGRTTSPGIFDVVAVLGRDEALARIRDQVKNPR